jgi:hypothetical protein
MRGLPQVAILLVAGAVAGGCGSSHGSSDSSRPGEASARAQVAAYLSAFNRGDGRSACSLLSAQAKAGVPHLSGLIHAPDCAGAIRELSRISEHIRSPRISVRVQGTLATAKVRSKRPPYQSDVPLSEEDGAWQIDYPPALVERFKTPPGIPSELK